MNIFYGSLKATILKLFCPVSGAVKFCPCSWGKGKKCKCWEIKWYWWHCKLVKPNSRQNFGNCASLAL